MKTDLKADDERLNILEWLCDAGLKRRHDFSRDRWPRLAASLLADVPLDDLRHACRAIAQDQEWMPTAAEIRHRVGRKAPVILSSEAVIHLISLACQAGEASWYGTEKRRELEPVRRTIEALGGIVVIQQEPYPNTDDIRVAYEAVLKSTD
jgi:hypothetical protein